MGLASTIVLARLLTPADFGIVAIATSILAIGLALTEMSLAAALVQREEVHDEHFHSAWTFSLARSLIIFLAVALVAYPLAGLYDDPHLAPVIIATGLIVAIPGFASPTIIMYTRNLVFWQDFAIQITQQLAVFAVSVTVAVMFRSYWALIAGNLAGSIVNVCLSYVISPFRPRLGISRLKELFSFSIWLAMGNALNTINWKLDQLILGFLVGKSAIGIYTVADNIAALPVRESTTPLRKTLFPAFARMANDMERLKQAYTRTQNMLFAVAMPVGFGFAVIAEPVVTTFLGEKWLEAIPIIQILSATFAFQSISNSLEPLAMAKDATRTLFGRDVRTLLIRVPLIAAGYLLGGLMGVVVGRAISSAIGAVWNMSLVATLSGISVMQQFRSCWRTMASTMVMAAATFGILNILDAPHVALPQVAVIVLSALSGALIYASAMMALWILSGKPIGVETEITTQVLRLVSRLNSKHRSPV
jgi:O-antigen/teichoic acid export membrane protein